MSKKTLLSDPNLRRALGDWIRRRVPADEVEDVIQATLIEALASASAPAEPEELRRWVWGIARHKIADLHRKHRREEPAELPDIEGPQEDQHAAEDLLRWAQRELPPGDGAKQTLGWLLREGEGEKLEHIAEGEALPAPRVRQRVTRLRQHFRARWQSHLAAVATLVGAGILLWWWFKPRVGPEPQIVKEAPSAPAPVDPSIDQARQLRRLALERCAERDFVSCIEGLDRAAALDPAGDQADEVREARRVAGVLPTPPGPSVIPTGAPEDMKKAPTPAKERLKDAPPAPSGGTTPSLGRGTSGDSGLELGSKGYAGKKAAPKPTAKMPLVDAKK